MSVVVQCVRLEGRVRVAVDVGGVLVGTLGQTVVGKTSVADDTLGSMSPDGRQTVRDGHRDGRGRGRVLIL